MLAHRAGEGGWSVGGHGAGYKVIEPSAWYPPYRMGQLFGIVQAAAPFCVEGSGRFSLRCLVKIGLNCRLLIDSSYIMVEKNVISYSVSRKSIFE